MQPLDFKNAPSLKQLIHAWQENYGNWLLAIGLAVSLLTWSIGYFDMIPEIRAVRRPSRAAPVFNGRSLMVHVVDCASDEGKVVAMLYNGDGFDETSIPLRVESLPIDKQNAFWSIHNLPFGRYAVYAFHDVDGDDTVDPARERQGLSFRTDPESENDASASPATPYSKAVFDFEPDRRDVTIQLR